MPVWQGRNKFDTLSEGWLDTLTEERRGNITTQSYFPEIQLMAQVIKQITVLVSDDQPLADFTVDGKNSARCPQIRCTSETNKFLASLDMGGDDEKTMAATAETSARCHTIGDPSMFWSPIDYSGGKGCSAVRRHLCERLVQSTH